MPYLRNSIAYDHDFWYTCVKWWYLQVVFFQFFKILISWVVRGIKELKGVQNDKKFCLSLIWLSFMVHLCKIIISPGVFFIFFLILIFWVFRGVKGQAVQNHKTLVVLHIWEAINHMTVIYVWKMIISSGVFFQNFDFLDP